MMTPPTNLASFTSALTAKITQDLSAWYGPEAKLFGEPAYQPRPWSYFFRYSLHIADNTTKAVLVKIRHTQTMSIIEAMRDDKMRAEMQDEYKALVKINETFSKFPEDFFAIRPLALYKDLNVLIMEEAEIRPVKSYFRAHANFETIITRTGRWLRLFHDQIGTTHFNGPLLSEAWYESTSEQLTRLSNNVRNSVFSDAQAYLDKLKKLNAQDIPYRTLHEDFNAANVFVTLDGKICSFDPHNRPGPIYYDLAKILTDLEMSRLQTLTFGLRVPPTWLRKYRAALLHGYFADTSYDEAALDLFRLLTIIERWGEAEINYRQATGRKKLIYLASLPQMRLFFGSLLRKQLANLA